MIYISGPITGTTDYQERFQKAEDFLTPEYGHRILNPVKATKLCFGEPEKMKREHLMLYCLECLCYCDKIYMLKGWKVSYGAYIELLWAEMMNMEVIYE